MTKATKMLKMLQMQVIDKDNDMLRDLIDRWFCYTNGYISSSGKANWGQIIGSEWVTEAFEEVKVEDHSKDTIVQKEHIIPLRIIAEMLFELKDPTIEAIEAVLLENMHYATITKEEDMMLNAAGLNNKMPSEYYDPTSPLFGDKFARYRKVDIELYRA